MNITSPFHPDYKHTGNQQLQPARSYIKDNIDPKYGKKLLKGVETYIKYIAKVNYHEFKVTDLASNLNEIAKQRGVGRVSINTLKQQLKQDGWL